MVLQDALLAVAGVSNKARRKLSAAQLDSLIQAVIASIAEQAKATHLDFREELVDRYLLTQGDALGGKMRNWIGAAAQRKLTDAIKLALGSQQIEDHAKPSGKTDRIAWDNRLLLFDVRPKLIDKNVDVILLSASPMGQDPRTLLDDPDRYLAAGELKGGIDPAGADEHWKTANSAFQRIRGSTRFGNGRPKLFFVGAAIADAQAKEIFEQLTDSRLSYAANLTLPEQLNDLADWLVHL